MAIIGNLSRRTLSNLASFSEISLQEKEFKSFSQKRKALET
jgi:hypothetical protein